MKTNGVWDSLNNMLNKPPSLHDFEYKINCLAFLAQSSGCPFFLFNVGQYASSEFRRNYVPCEYSSVNEAWKVYFYVNGGASAIGDA